MINQVPIDVIISLLPTDKWLLHVTTRYHHWMGGLPATARSLRSNQSWDFENISAAGHCIVVCWNVINVMTSCILPCC